MNRAWLAVVRERIQPWTKRAGAVGGSALIAGALVAGVLFGDGFGRTVVDTSDGTTWVGDDRRGDVVQVNPSTGQSESRVHVAAPESDVDIAQRDGLLVVIDRKSGTVTFIDLATLLPTGRRQVTPGNAAKALLDGDRTYLADREKGTITNVDPASANIIGEQWRAAGGLADAGIDRAGTVWALDRTGRLHKLAWSGGENRFVDKGQHTVDGAGAASALVTHERGVTVLSPEAGVAAQLDTGTDFATAAPGLRTPLWAAESSPADLVPAAVEPTGTVVMLRGPEVLEIPVNKIQCDRPGRPAVLQRMVYVPCLGARKVISLNEKGRSDRPDIITPEGGDPELVLDDGRIVVNVPGADKGFVVEPDGTPRPVSTPHPGDKAPDPADKPADRPAPGGAPQAGPPGGAPSDRPKGTGPPKPRDQQVGGGQPRPPAPPSQPPPPPPDPPTPEEVVPTAVTSRARPDGSVLVSWTPGPKRPERFNVFFQPTRNGTPVRGAATPLVAQAPGGATSAVVGTLSPGTVGVFFVLGLPPGYQQGQTLPSSPLSNEVSTYSRPGAPADIQVAAPQRSRGTRAGENGVMLIASIRWAAAPAHGRPITNYRISVYVDNLPPVVFQTSRTLVRSIEAECSNPTCANTRLRVQVAAINEAGDGEPGVHEATVSPPLAPPPTNPSNDPGKENGGGEPK